MFSLFKQVASVGQKLPTAFNFTPPLSSTFTATQAPTSPSKSMRVLSSVTSSGQPEPIETTSISSPVESIVSPRPNEEETHEVQPGLKLSLWLQWTLQKFVVKLYGREKDSIGKILPSESTPTNLYVHDIMYYTKNWCIFMIFFQYAVKQVCICVLTPWVLSEVLLFNKQPCHFDFISHIS